MRLIEFVIMMLGLSDAAAMHQSPAYNLAGDAASVCEQRVQQSQICLASHKHNQPYLAVEHLSSVISMDLHPELCVKHIPGVVLVGFSPFFVLVPGDPPSTLANLCQECFGLIKEDVCLCVVPLNKLGMGPSCGAC